MIKFLKNNLDFSYRYRGDEKYYPAYECLDAFSNAFEVSKSLLKSKYFKSVFKLKILTYLIPYTIASNVSSYFSLTIFLAKYGIIIIMI